MECLAATSCSGRLRIGRNRGAVTGEMDKCDRNRGSLTAPGHGSAGGGDSSSCRDSGATNRCADRTRRIVESKRIAVCPYQSCEIERGRSRSASRGHVARKDKAADMPPYPRSRLSHCRAHLPLMLFADRLWPGGQRRAFGRTPFRSEITISTRRFCCRPAAVSFVATGYILP